MKWRIFLDNDILERLLRLADPDRPKPENQPPITTFVVRSEPMGERYVATEEYREWFCRTYGVVRDEVAQPQAGTSEPDQGDGKQTKPMHGLSRFKAS